MATREGTDKGKKRRADAERSRAAILDAAVRLFSKDPDAGLAAVAAAAGVTRQTVYAHFAAREDLVRAVVERVAEESDAALGAAALDEGTAAEALVRLLEMGFGTLEANPVLLVTPGAGRHTSIAERLADLVRRGQRGGEFDPGLDPDWGAAAVIALGHAAGAELGDGHLTRTAALEAVRLAALRVLGAKV